MTRAALIDQIARALAANAGVSWETLSSHPGFTQNLWRERAEAFLRTIAVSTPATLPASSAPPSH